MHHKRNKKIIGLSILPAVVILSYALVTIYFLSEEKRIYERYNQILQNQYEITLSIYSDMSNLVFNGSINTPDILEILQKAYHSENEADKDANRRLLYSELESLYQYLIKYNFRQIHFHEKDNRSFLRVHKPDLYGDDLTGIRYSVEYVNRERQFISGFEEGRIYNGYRFVYPLSYKDENLGSVEVSVSLKTVIDQLYDKFGQSSQFILLRSQVEKKVFASELNHYKDWPVSELFMMDRDLGGRLLLDKELKPEDQEAIVRILTDPEERGKPFSMGINYNKEQQIVSFLPIKNITGSVVAYLFTLDSTDILIEQRHAFWLVSLVFLLLILSLIALIFYYYRSDKKIENLIIYDQLTRAYSRNSILDRVTAELEQFQRYGRPFCIVMMDIDHFKKVNDKFGHLTGDSVLFELSEVVRNNIRKTDYFGRYGGEEFLLLLQETSAMQAWRVAENLRKQIAENPFEKVGTLTVSCGITEMSTEIETLHQLLEAADEKLYKAKESGRNRVVL